MLIAFGSGIFIYINFMIKKNRKKFIEKIDKIKAEFDKYKENTIKNGHC